MTKPQVDHTIDDTYRDQYGYHCHKCNLRFETMSEVVSHAKMQHKKDRDVCQCGCLDG